jgi:Mg/Co/Ni transporter MgtE
VADAEVLTLAYVTSHAADAARVLERQPTSEAAAVLVRLPARAAAPVLVAMFPPAAARVIGAVGEEVALGLLTAAGAQGAVGVLRHVAEPRRSRLVEGLPTVTAVAARLLLGYPEDTVGAWADPQVVALPPGLYAHEAFARVRSETEEEGGEVFVVGEDQRLLGVVDLATLVRAPDWRTLEGLMRPPAATLAAVMPLGGAVSHPAWKRATELPVVARGGRLIGALRLSVLAEAFARSRGGGRGEGDMTLAGFAARGYWDAVAGLVRAFLVLVPPARPVVKEEP